MKSKYRKLFIIGNGFDRWQGLPTSYDHFKNYYRKNIQEIANSLHIKTVINQNGSIITPVEMLFGDISKPNSLPEEFFWSFESALALLDDQELINHFDKSHKGLYSLQEMVDEAQRILRRAYGNWVTSIKISSDKANYHFGNDSYFINFNYTDTLRKRFSVEETNDYHIHGEATDPESIIFGHSSHPEMAFPELMEQKFSTSLSGGKSKRLQGLYIIEDALYETDKHVQDNIDDLCEVMALDAVNIEDFTDIYVLGHSLAEVDYEYFEFLVKATQAECNFNELSALWKVRKLGLENLDEISLADFIQYNIVYATNHRNRALGKSDIRFPRAEALERAVFGQVGIITDNKGNIHQRIDMDGKASEAVHKRFIMEQAVRTKKVIEELCILKGVNYISEECLSVLKAADFIDGRHEPRKQDATWHISCFSNQDRIQAEKVMKRAGCKNYILYYGIDECIEEFKV